MAALDFPSSPTNGQVFGNWVYNSTKQAWQSTPLTPAKTVNSPTPPSSPAAGDQWFNTNNGSLYIYYTDANTSQWVESRAPITADGYISPNYIINGGFDIWQRGTTFNSVANNAYLADRWLHSYSGSGSTRNITQQVVTPGTDLGRETPYYININQTVAGTGATWNEFATLLEDARTLAGKTVTFSFWAKSSTSSVITGTFAGQTFGVSGRIDTAFSPSGQTIQLTTAWKRYSYTTTLPSVAGKSFGPASYLFVAFQFPLNATYSIDLANVQLEEGSVATPFRRNANSIQGELAACQRYYAYSGLHLSSMSGLGSSTTRVAHWRFPVDMRTTPTITASGGELSSGFQPNRLANDNRQCTYEYTCANSGNYGFTYVTANAEF